MRTCTHCVSLEGIASTSLAGPARKPSALVQLFRTSGANPQHLILKRPRRQLHLAIPSLGPVCLVEIHQLRTTAA